MKRNNQKVIFAILIIILICSSLTGFAHVVEESNKLFGKGIPNSLLPEIIITGTILDENGLGLPGVNVSEKGTTHGTITDMDGKYSLSVSQANAVIVFSFIGYVTRTIELKDQTLIDLKMEPEISTLKELVIVGYGTQEKATLSGSVSTLKGAEVAKSPSFNVTNSIAGKIPGLVAVGQSGEPGEDYSTLYIRGLGTLNNNAPLIVVDGVPNRSLERIDPATIESITVLKDASAAIYGSQAANGVILVTTKRGSSEGLVFTANYTMGFTRPTKIPDLCSSAEFATLVNEIDYYDHQSPTYSQDEIENYSNGSDLWRYPNTDWFHEVLKPWSLQQNANFTMSGGNEAVQSFVSISTRNQDGFFYNSASKYIQNDFRSNIDFKINEYVKVSVDANMRLEKRDFPTVSSSTIFRDLMTAMPMQIAEWPNGLPGPPLDPTSQNNPLVQSTHEAGTSESDNFVLNFNSKLDIKIPWVDGLSWTTSLTFDRGNNNYKYFSNKYTLYEWDGVTLDDNGDPYLTPAQYGSSNLHQQLDISNAYLLNSLVSYQKKIKEMHDINLLAGIETIENSSSWFAAERRNFANNFPAELNFGDVNQQYANGSNPGINRWLNYFGRMNYAFGGRYIAEFVWRYQGSSKFSPETRWGFFPGVSLAYRMSSEKFWLNSRLGDIVNNFKIRGSWGKTGNDLITPYQYYSLYELNFMAFVTADQAYHQTYNESHAGNAKAQWEEAHQSNLGIDASFFKSKLTFTADYFNNLRSKILITQTASVPTMTGLAYILPDINLGKVRNNGFDFELAYNNQLNQFKYQVGLNGCYAKNKVLFFDEAEGYSSWQTQTGHPMYSGLYYEAIGIFQKQEDLNKYPHVAEARTGDVIFKDVSGDGLITGDDMTRIYKNTIPTLTGGLTLSGNYKGFDITIFLQGQAGAVRYLQDMGGKGVSNYLKTVYDSRWTESHPDTDYPRTFNRNDEYWVSSVNPNTFWLRKTDFIRLKNLEIGYTLPAVLSKRFGVDNLRLHAGGLNLFTFCPDIKDYDPELEPKGDGFAGQGYPLQQIMTAGISIQF